MCRPGSPQRIHRLQRLAQNLFIEEGDGVKGLVLGAGCGIPVTCQFGEKAFQFPFAGQGVGHLLDRRHVTAQPMHIGIFRGQSLVLPPENVTQTDDGISGVHTLTFLSGIRAWEGSRLCATPFS